MAPFHRILLLGMKLVPVRLSVKPGSPEFFVVGLIAVIVGTGLLIVKVLAAEVPPPGAGLNTVTLAVPGVAISVFRIDALTWVGETKVVVRLAPFHRT